MCYNRDEASRLGSNTCTRACGVWAGARARDIKGTASRHQRHCIATPKALHRDVKGTASRHQRHCITTSKALHHDIKGTASRPSRQARQVSAGKQRQHRIVANQRQHKTVVTQQTVATQTRRGCKARYSPVWISRPPLRAQNSTGLSRGPVYPAQFEGVDTLSLRIRIRTGLAREPIHPAPVYADRTVQEAEPCPTKPDRKAALHRKR